MFLEGRTIISLVGMLSNTQTRRSDYCILEPTSLCRLPIITLPRIVVTCLVNLGLTLNVQMKDDTDVWSRRV